MKTRQKTWNQKQQFWPFQILLESSLPLPTRVQVWFGNLNGWLIGLLACSSDSSSKHQTPRPRHASPATSFP